MSCHRLKALDDNGAYTGHPAASSRLRLYASFRGSRTLRHRDTSAPQNWCRSLTFKTNHRWSCVSSELSWVEVSRLFLDHGTRVEVSRTVFLLWKCLETGAEVSQSRLMPKCLVAEVSGNRFRR